ncbi:MAG: LysR family transcriptional regulator [Syntrophaceae bacterium]|nr:LysR family transcriptional regulator [Syntrophaceae bacterium]
MEIKFKLWIEQNGITLFGHGLEELLKGIDEYQSLFGAARKLKMSYRAAWGKIKDAEKRTGIQLVVTNGRKGMLLTENARRIVMEFENMENNINQLLHDCSNSFPIPDLGGMQNESHPLPTSKMLEHSRLHMPHRAYA